MNKIYKKIKVFTNGMQDGMCRIDAEIELPYIFCQKRNIQIIGEFGSYVFENENEEIEILPESEFSKKYIILDQMAMRSMLLTATDWTELPSARFTDEQRAAWVAWREAVRDWKTEIDCPIPPNESEYCLQELWDKEQHKVKL